MNIVVINGTQVKGCTYQIKSIFLSAFDESCSITEFYLPQDMPHFCTGCKRCFMEDEALCPHVEYVMPIWKAMLEADLLVFSSPVYALRTTGQMKALLDHFCCHWMVHRPNKKMFSKHTAILTNSIGAPNGAAQKDIKTSLNWPGVSSVKRLGFGLMEGVIWDQLSQGRREKITRKTLAFASRFQSIRPRGKSIKIRLYFLLCKIMHKSVLKKEDVPSADNRHWIKQGWISPKKTEED